MLRRSTISRVSAGISAMQVFVPPARVDLKNWAQWTNNSYDKISSVVGQSFRVCAQNEDAYTMAATAALRLILTNNIDPQSIGMLATGTESSTDGSAGAVIVRGMLDAALKDLGMKPLSRECEVPELSHACLGGIYALKNAVRYCQTDGLDKKAIVIATDIAEYALGSTGEQTQGAGACAMLVERKPALLELDLSKAGSSSSYRGCDFRKPHRRHFMPAYGASAATADKPTTDHPVFSGGYSTVCYTEAVTQSVEAMLRKLNRRKSEALGDAAMVLFHRPYQMMAVNSMSTLWVRALAKSASHRAEFEALCAQSKTTPDAVIKEIDTVSPDTDLFALLESTNRKVVPNISPLVEAVAKNLRKSANFNDLVSKKMSLGGQYTCHLGNLYTGSLPAWLASAFDEAYQKQVPLAGKSVFLIGYGSGDASEAIPCTVVGGWEKAASKIGVKKLIEEDARLDLTQEQYTKMHSGTQKEDLCAGIRTPNQFVISHIGEQLDANIQNLGIAYYKLIK
jgi:hydroxymethylglutaryl-CoA synthase